MTRSWLLVGCSVGLLSAGCDGSGGDAEASMAPPPLPSQDLPFLGCLDPAPAGGECASDAECGSSLCVLEATREVGDRAALPLSCGAPQGVAEARDGCDAREDCQSGLCSLTGTCLTPCASSSDCVTGMFCVPVEVRLNAQAQAPVNACARNLAFEADVQISVGPSTRLDASGDRGEIALAPSQGTSLIYLQSQCTAELQVTFIQSREDGQDLFDLNDALLGRPSPNPATNVGSLVPILVPNNPDLRDYEQGLDVGVIASRSTEVGALVAARRPSGQRVLDLNLFYVGAGREEEEGGFHPGNPRVLRMVEELRTLYGRIDISLASVREYEVVGGLREELSVLESEIIRDDQGNTVGLDVPGLDRLFELSMGLEYGGINLFLLSDMGDLLGISGGIPGALDVQGTAASGVALALDVIGIEDAAQVAMHEMSHQMGLFHTTEFDGSTIEPLADTPACSSANDRNGDGILAPSECRLAGADNLMFWSGAGLVVSPEQQEVLRRSIVLR
jgi:hypothetical protein